MHNAVESACALMQLFAMRMQFLRSYTNTLKAQIWCFEACNKSFSAPKNSTGTSTSKLDKYFAVHFPTFDEQHAAHSLTHAHDCSRKTVEVWVSQIKSNIKHANSSFRLSKSENFIFVLASKQVKWKEQKHVKNNAVQWVHVSRGIHLVFRFHFVDIYEVIKCLHTKHKMN